MSKELNNMPTRDYLAEHGEELVYHINHEEYRLGDVVYVCGWKSPSHKLTPEESLSYDGWIVWKKDDKDENQWTGG